MGSFFLTLEFQKAHLLVPWKRWLDLRSQVMSSVLHLCPLVGFPPRQLSSYDASRSYSRILSNLQTGKTRACFWQQSSLAFLSWCADYWDIRVVREIPNDMPSPELVELEGAGEHKTWAGNGLASYGLRKGEG